MKNLLSSVTLFFALSLTILQFGCRTVCIDCTKELPVFNGVTSPNDAAINTANLAVDPSTTVEVRGDDLILKARVICKVEGGNNDAWGVKVVVLLPAEVYIRSFSGPNGCLIWGTPEGLTDSRVKTGFLTFEQRTLERGESINIEVTTSKTSKTLVLNKENFAVFAYSRSADLILCDNYWCWKDPIIGCK